MLTRMMMWLQTYIFSVYLPGPRFSILPFSVSCLFNTFFINYARYKHTHSLVHQIKKNRRNKDKKQTVEHTHKTKQKIQ